MILAFKIFLFFNKSHFLDNFDWIMMTPKDENYCFDWLKIECLTVFCPKSMGDILYVPNEDKVWMNILTVTFLLFWLSIFLSKFIFFSNFLHLVHTIQCEFVICFCLKQVLWILGLLLGWKWINFDFFCFQWGKVLFCKYQSHWED